jgi:hypothetical protein
MELIETIPVGIGGQASITFSSIAANWTDLYIVVSGKSTRTNSPRDDIKLQFNGVTSGYSYKFLEGTGSTANSSGASSQAQILVTHALSTNSSGLGNLFGNASIYIHNYLSSSNKSISSDETAIRNSTDSHSAIQASLSTVTSPITSIYLSPENGDFTQYSTASLYGILAGSDGTTTVT